MKRTISQTIVDALVARGWAIQPDASRRYVVLHKEGSSCAWVWVGRNGAARFAPVKRIDSSVPFSDRTRALLLAGTPHPLKEST